MEVLMNTTILATVMDISSITNPSDKDKEQGMKIKVVVKHEPTQNIAGKDYVEVHFYSLKLKETLVKVGDKVVIEGRAWSLENGLKGFSNPKIIKMG